MGKFKVGDKVQLYGDVVEVLEVSTCREISGDDVCKPGVQVYRFKDPETGEDQWTHADEGEKVA